ncbi:MAG: 2-dehydropantoate 2-reductase, partial [Candidatus Hydrogenedentes bacterium]|nr:2-dehydropantoate 2-reductase [Candidatus Hydrogenedentota bacterium]
IGVKVIDDLAECPNAEIVILAVKNYSLDTVARLIREKVVGDPIVVGLQNGIANQTILPKYFQRVVYGVIGYNTWMDEPGLIGYQKKGPVILGTPGNVLQEELNTVAALFNLGVDAPITSHLNDAVHSKLIINLTNSVTTIVGHGIRPISSYALLQRILSNLLYEGVQIAKAAGFKECKIGGMPSWLLLRASATLPQAITRPLFKKNLAKMVISSMAQDVIQRHSSQSELDTINGYFVELAQKTGVHAPYNKAVYELCKREFARPNFQPLDVQDVWNEIAQRL